MLLAWNLRALALNPALEVNQYAHTLWKVREGFSLGAVFAMAQTPDGYLWLGGQFGLFRFDGVRFIPWQPPAGQQLPDRPLSLLVTRDGTLWIGTFAGLFRLEKYDPTGQHHIAVIELRPRVIDRTRVGSEVQRPDGLIPFEGLGKEERYAEVLGHELAHAADILLNPELARQVEEQVEQTNALLLASRRRRDITFFAGTEMNQRIEIRGCTA